MDNNQDKNIIIQRILDLCSQKHYSLYRLAKESNIPNTTLTNMVRTDTMPTFPTIQKICKGLDISIPQFFMSEDYFQSLTDNQREILRLWESLDKKQRLQAMAYLEGLAQSKQLKKELKSQPFFCVC